MIVDIARLEKAERFLAPRACEGIAGAAKALWIVRQHIAIFRYRERLERQRKQA